MILIQILLLLKALMIAGLYTFGGNVNGLLLSNYAGTDLDACTALYCFQICDCCVHQFIRCDVLPTGNPPYQRQISFSLGTKFARQGKHLATGDMS